MGSDVVQNFKKCTKSAQKLKLKTFHSPRPILHIVSLLNRVIVWICLFKLLNRLKAVHYCWNWELLSKILHVSTPRWPNVPVWPGQSQFRARCPGVPKGYVRDAFMSRFEESHPGRDVGLVTFQFPIFYKRNCQRKPCEERRSRNNCLTLLSIVRC